MSLEKLGYRVNLRRCVAAFDSVAVLRGAIASASESAGAYKATRLIEPSF